LELGHHVGDELIVLGGEPHSRHFLSEVVVNVAIDARPGDMSDTGDILNQTAQVESVVCIDFFDHIWVLPC
jgi:hypothetical protein